MEGRDKIKYIKVMGLRKQGFSYGKIMKETGVPKSTVSNWVGKCELTERQREKLKEKADGNRRKAGLKGAFARKCQRIDRENKIKIEAKKELIDLIKDPLWLLGVVLYWGEGTKTKPWRIGECVILNNMDPEMIFIFRKWLVEKLGINKDNLQFQLYVHETIKDVERIKQFWSKKLQINKDEIRVYYKKNKINTLRKNIGNDYNGLIRIKVLKSTDLNRRIAGYIEGLIELFGDNR